MEHSGDNMVMPINHQNTTWTTKSHNDPEFKDVRMLEVALSNRLVETLVDICDKAVAHVDEKPAPALTAVWDLLDSLLRAMILSGDDWGKIWFWNEPLVRRVELQRLWELARAQAQLPANVVASEDLSRLFSAIIEGVQAMATHAGSTNPKPDYSILPAQVRLAANLVCSFALFLFDSWPGPPFHIPF